MWEYGHSFDEIDAMSIQDFGTVIGYWEEKRRGEEALRSERKNLSAGGE